CRAGTAYSVSKAEGELAAFERGRVTGVEIVALRPSLVYGAGAPLWVRGYFERVKSEQVALIDGGAGLANFVHIDDLIEAMLAAAVAPVDGEAFLISGAAPITWSASLGAFAEMLGKPRPPALPAWRARLELGWSRASTLLVGRPGRVQAMDLELMTQHTSVSIAKARARLGYAPRVGIVE